MVLKIEQIERSNKESEKKSALIDALGELKLILSFEPTSLEERLPQILGKIEKQIGVIKKMVPKAKLLEKQAVCEAFIGLVEKNLPPLLQEKIATIFIDLGKDAISPLIKEISSIKPEQEEGTNVFEGGSGENLNRLISLVEFISQIINKMPPQTVNELLPKLTAFLKDEKLDIILSEELTKTLAKAGNLAIKVLVSELSSDSEKTKGKIRNYSVVLNEVVLHKNVELQDKANLTRLYIDLLKQPKAEVSSYSNNLRKGLANIGEPAIEQLLPEINEQNIERILLFIEPLGEMVGKVDSRLLNKALPRLKELLTQTDSEFLQNHIQKIIDNIKATSKE